MADFNFPALTEKDRYKINLAQHAEDDDKTIEEYIKNSRHNYVILSDVNEPQHWISMHNSVWVEDGTDWIVYESREEAEAERHDLMKYGNHGNRVVTERYFLKLKGLI